MPAHFENALLNQYDSEGFYDELFTSSGEVRPEFALLGDWLNRMPAEELRRRQEAAERALMRMGITFQVYGEESKTERFLPFDILPRAISAAEWKQVDEGLRQRITAPNLFIQDVYGDKKIIKDNLNTELESNGPLTS